MNETPKENNIQKNTDLFMEVLDKEANAKHLEHLTAQITKSSQYTAETDVTAVLREAAGRTFQEVHNKNDSLKESNFDEVSAMVGMKLGDMGYGSWVADLLPPMGGGSMTRHTQRKDDSPGRS